MMDDGRNVAVRLDGSIGDSNAKDRQDILAAFTRIFIKFAFDVWKIDNERRSTNLHLFAHTLNPLPSFI